MARAPREERVARSTRAYRACRVWRFLARTIEEALEARQRQHAVAVRTKPLQLDALYEGDGGRTSVSWVGPIYAPAPKSYPGPRGSGVAVYRYRYRLGDRRWTALQSTANPGFELTHTREGEKLILFVQPIDAAGERRTPAQARLTISGPTLTPDDPGAAEPGEYGKAEMFPEP